MEHSQRSRRFNVVVYGATGYTGQFVSEELYRLQNNGRSDLKWAAAGRNRTKLENVLKASGVEGIDILIADVGDQDSLERMCAEAEVVIDCVGPYLLYGEPVVKACINQKCSYVDISGETFYMETIEAKYNEQARDAGVYIVSACGFDSIPNDIGALMVQRSFNGDLSYVDSYITPTGQYNDTTINTGTWESLLRSIKAQRKLMKLRKEQSLPALNLPTIKPPSRKPIFYSDVIGHWCVPFPGADKAVVHRSLRHRQESEGINAFKFRPYFGLDSIWQGIALLPLFALLLLLLMTDWGLNLLIKYHKFFSGGYIQTPKRDTLQNKKFATTLVGYGHSPGVDKSGSPDSKIVVKVSGIDPAYGATSAMLVQSALAIVYERDVLPKSGGVYTPAVAFGNTKIIQNLTDTGKVQFELIES
ncbi:saccharopine dehydrogenase-like oxidoreductase [Halichondria panicea]|uniref:saccharopine dehydrogenase-like oxidoreductase n=1 Tax=Halichondria panicea TaxID=6063 RepID=UPI00312B357E